MNNPITQQSTVPKAKLSEMVVSLLIWSDIVISLLSALCCSVSHVINSSTYNHTTNRKENSGRNSGRKCEMLILYKVNMMRKHGYCLLWV